MDPARSEHIPFVLDTSVFVNPDSQRLFGAGVIDALAGFLFACRRLGLACFMPPSVYRELMGFVDRKTVPSPNPLGLIVQKAPAVTVSVPASLLATWIGENRTRIDRGLRVAERAVRDAVKGAPETAVIQRMRRDYRSALREGTLDSVQDLELVLLGVEISGIVVSADTGLRSFGEKLGVRIMDPDQVAAYLAMESEGDYG